MAINFLKLQRYEYQKVLNTKGCEALAQVKKRHLTQSPIAIESNRELEMLVQKRLDSFIEQDIKSLEKVIDKKDYYFYGFTYDEVIFVDPETPITREEYEKN